MGMAGRRHGWLATLQSAVSGGLYYLVCIGVPIHLCTLCEQDPRYMFPEKLIADVLT